MKYLDNLKVKATECKDWFDLAKSSKKKRAILLYDIEKPLLEDYRKYNSKVRSYRSKFSQSKLKDNYTVLLDFYNKPPSNLDSLICDRRHNHGLNECPFCGKPVSPGTLDHFIPKNSWPEYSILQNNLVPQCKECAPIKGDDYHSDNGHAIFLNPIFSKLLSFVEFKIKIEFNEEVKSINFLPKIVIPNNLSKKDQRRILSHFKALKIKSRIIKYSARTMKRWENALKASDFDISAALQTRIDERSDEERCRDWKSSLYTSVLKHHEYMQYLNSLKGVNAKPKRKIRKKVELDI
ncbi:hypothetical protein [Thaumasiovibrio subtropicus]|uniref:hypothetical protein n=1 Tax=Thaumasiovibrio subtropicus TaxID=1891207 RepID=UPI001C8654F0|nr:hypothetical protein [Thaumasiovibrio subtropicus]